MMLILFDSKILRMFRLIITCSNVPPGICLTKTSVKSLNSSLFKNTLLALSSILIERSSKHADSTVTLFF